MPPREPPTPTQHSWARCRAALPPWARAQGAGQSPQHAGMPRAQDEGRAEHSQQFRSWNSGWLITIFRVGFATSSDEKLPCYFVISNLKTSLEG